MRQLLHARNLSVAVAETLTGGLLCASLAGSHFRGGIVCGSGSDDRTAPEMASAVRAQFATDLGIAVHGHYELSGDRATGKVLIALESESDRKTVSRTYPGAPEQIARRAVNHALLALRGFLLNR